MHMEYLIYCYKICSKKSRVLSTQFACFVDIKGLLSELCGHLTNQLTLIYRNKSPYFLKSAVLN